MLAVPSPTRHRYSSVKRVTLEEFWAIPEGPPNYEFEDGELIEMVSPNDRHQDVLGTLYTALRSLLLKEKLGKLWLELDVHLPNVRHVYIPDLVFLATDHLSCLSKEDGKIHGVPDLVVEISSPSTQRKDRTKKKNTYHQAGVTWYWMVDAVDLTIEECKWTPEGYLIAQSIAAGEPFTPKLFPSLTFNLADLMGEEFASEE
ncbi:MAG: Uma2 family endonuclease [Chloroflexi bacterium]|nr:Uma2 family endonuclease [Chloroflexota bacterium]